MSIQRLSPAASLGLSQEALGRLMPLYISVGAGGQIQHVGPTLGRIAPAVDLLGQPLDHAITLLRPRQAATLEALLACQGRRVKLSLACVPNMIWTAMVVAVSSDGGAVLNLSFGASILEAVARFRLTLRDFAPTELTAELLFLVEAKSAAFNQSRDLNSRLDGAKREAQEQALTDALTGLRNRRAMERELSLLTHPGAEQCFGVMHIDLDHFKAVNDTMGHAAGDHVLTHVAQVLKDETRKADMVCRVGGDEFVLVMKDCDDLELLHKIALRIIEVLEVPIPFEGQMCRISASIGTTVSSFYPDPQADEMLSDADDATYQSKHAGRATHTIFDPSHRGQSGALH